MMPLLLIALAKRGPSSTLGRLLNYGAFLSSFFVPAGSREEICGD